MELQGKIAEIVYQAYRNINFVKNYKLAFLKYNFKLDDVMSKMDKKENLNILKELGYNFKIFTPGQYYDFEEKFGNITLKLSCQISGGIITCYVYIYKGNIIIDPNLLKSNLTFVYRYLLNDSNAVTNAFKFRNFDDFRNAMSDLISIYEDFKKEFLKLLKEENLLDIE